MRPGCTGPTGKKGRQGPYRKTIDRGEHPEVRFRMTDVTIYSSAFCPYCYMAKKLLQKKGVDFVEIDVMAQPRRRDEMIERAGGRRTVPQVFIGDTHVGGNDDLQALDREGRLDQLLEAVR